MKVLVLAPVFSGLRDSVASGRWQPRGVPAVTRLLEALGARPDIELRCEFLTQDADLRAAAGPVAFPEIGPARIAYLGGSPLRRWMRQVLHAVRILAAVLRDRPDVVYAYNSAILPAGLIARLGLCPVVFRFLGIHPFHKALTTRRGGVLRWLFGARFAKVVCTRDGSGGGEYLPKLLRPGTDLTVLLNGVDSISATPEEVDAFRAEYGLDGRLPLVLFVGRLEPNKGAMEFIDACDEAMSGRPGSFQALIVGDGSERGEVEDEIARRGLGGAIRLAGALPHRAVRLAYAAAAVYVSLNRYGNLSNTNLEAISAGLCLVILGAEAESATDVETLDVIPEGSAIRLDRSDVTGDLARTLAALIESQQHVAAYRDKARAMAGSIQPWEARIAREIGFIAAAAWTRPE